MSADPYGWDRKHWDLADVLWEADAVGEEREAYERALALRAPSRRRVLRRFVQRGSDLVEVEQVVRETRG